MNIMTFTLCNFFDRIYYIEPINIERLYFRAVGTDFTGNCTLPSYFRHSSVRVSVNKEKTACLMCLIFLRIWCGCRLKFSGNHFLLLFIYLEVFNVRDIRYVLPPVGHSQFYCFTARGAKFAWCSFQY